MNAIDIPKKSLPQRILSTVIFRDDVIKFILDSFRNTGIASFVIWAGFMMEIKNPSHEEYPEFGSGILMSLGAILFLYNLLHVALKLLHYLSSRSKMMAVILLVILGLPYTAIIGGILVMTVHTKGGPLLPSCS